MIIYLNGASSSGKSSIAKELVSKLDGEFIHIDGDVFGQEDAHQRLAELHDGGDKLKVDAIW